MKARHRLSNIIMFGVVLSIVALWSLNHVEAGTGALDGKTFTGRTGEKGKEANGEDELRFENGKLFSVGCAKWEFGEGVYNARVEGDKIHFEAVTLSPKHGQIVWKGTVIDDTIDATYIWTKKRWWWKDAYLEKWLKGTVKK